MSTLQSRTTRRVARSLRASFATAVLLMSSPAAVSATIIVACNELGIYPYSPGCPNTSGPCIIEETVVCSPSVCGGDCTYNFGTRDLTVQGSLGAFVTATGTSADITVYAGTIATSTEATIVRFDAGGNGNTVSLNADTMDIVGKVRSSGSSAGNVFISAVGGADLSNIDTSATGTGTGGNVDIYSSDFVWLGKVDAFGPGGGGSVTVTSTGMTIGGPISTKSTGTGTAGAVNLLSNSGGSIGIYGNILASVTASGSTAGGGAVRLERSSPAQLHPHIFIYDVIDVGATSGDAGSITVVGSTISMAVPGSAGALKANANSVAGTTGGTITVAATGGDSTFRAIEASGETGGVVTISSNYKVTLDKDVDVSSNQGPAGAGGVISVRTLTRNAIPNCWDCQLPGDPCYCGTPTSCTQTIQINENLVASGTGTSGVGGVIALEAPYVYMRASGTARKVNANANPGIDSTSGSSPGRVRVRARDSQFKARTDTGTDHKIRALPDAGGVSEICITQPFGGNYAPPFAICGPTYAPQCNPG